MCTRYNMVPAASLCAESIVLLRPESLSDKTHPVLGDLPSTLGWWLRRH